MAGAKGRVLTSVTGSIENGSAHYGFVRNGKQFIGCVRKGWNTELKTDTQKINAVIFRNNTLLTNVVTAHVLNLVEGKELTAEQQTVTSKIEAAFNLQDIWDGFKAQPIDENTGYAKDYPTLHGFILAVVMYEMREEKGDGVGTFIKGIFDDLGVTFYAESLEGYTALKASKGGNGNFVVD